MHRPRSLPPKSAVLLAQAVEAVRAVGDDLLDAVAVQRLDVLLREHLEEVLVAHAARRVSVAGLLVAEDREGDARRVQDLDEGAWRRAWRGPRRSRRSRPRRGPRSPCPRPRPSSSTGRPVRPVGARGGGNAPRIAVGLHSPEGVLDLLRELRLVENQVAAHLDDLVHRRNDEDRAGRSCSSRRSCTPRSCPRRSSRRSGPCVRPERRCRARRPPRGSAGVASYTASRSFADEDLRDRAACRSARSGRRRGSARTRCTCSRRASASRSRCSTRETPKCSEFSRSAVPRLPIGSSFIRKTLGMAVRMWKCLEYGR